MRTMIIEWRHLKVEDETCDRCYDTGENLTNEVKRLNRTFEPQGVHIEIEETVLDENQVAESNALLFNGVPIEDILDIKISESYCESCSELIGKPTSCRSVVYAGQEYDDVPAKAIRHAAHHMLGENMKEEERASEHVRACCCAEGGSDCCG
mgnify:CR=1 FL=1